VGAIISEGRTKAWAVTPQGKNGNRANLRKNPFPPWKKHENRLEKNLTRAQTNKETQSKIRGSDRGREMGNRGLIKKTLKEKRSKLDTGAQR